jgi:hypothetical protein
LAFWFFSGKSAEDYFNSWVHRILALQPIRRCFFTSSRLIDIAAAVQDYVASVPTAIDPKLRSALKGIEAVSLPLVIAFHFFVSAAFTVTMMLFRVASISQPSSTKNQADA